MSGEALAKAAETPAKARLRLWLRLLKVSRKIEAELRENFRSEFASTLPRFDVMAALSRHADGLKMSELSGVLKVSNGNVTGIVDRLVEEGLIIRVPVEGDRRATLVRLTKKGAEQFAIQAEAHEGWINHLLKDFAPDESEDMAGRLDDLIHLQEAEDAAEKEAK